MEKVLSEGYQQRFSGIARLYGEQALRQIAEAHCVVIGLGGVGSWAAEALARTGVGKLTIMDLDDVCVTNTNRQLPALSETIGQSKTAVMAHRLKQINPELCVQAVEDWISKDNLSHYLQPGQIVLDAIDSAAVKADVIAYCLARKIRLVTVGSAGGKTDPCQIRCDDLAKTQHDALLAKVREQLYYRYHFQKSSHRRFRVDAVFSLQQAVYPKPDGEVCQQKSAMIEGLRLDCTQGFGSSTMLTASMGLAAAERVIGRYLQQCNI